MRNRRFFVLDPKSFRALGRRSRRRRQALLLNVTTVARELNLSPHEFEKFESGRLSLTTSQLTSLSQILRTTENELTQGLVASQ